MKNKITNFFISFKRVLCSRFALRNRSTEENKCVECGAYHGHSPECSLMDEACAKKMLKEYCRVWLDMEMKHRKYCSGLYKQIKNEKKNTEFWKGKFVVVKHENNQLRRKVAKQNGA